MNNDDIPAPSFRVRGKREKAQVYQLIMKVMVPEGVVAAFEEVVGEKWKPFERLENNAGPTLDRKAAGVQMAAFD